MVITLTPELERALLAAATRDGITPEALAINTLRERFQRPAAPVAPRDEWERRLLAIATDCGVSLADEALSRENIYD